MKYKVYWSILDTPSYQITANWIFLILFIAGVFVWFYPKYINKTSTIENKVIMLWGGGFFAVFGLLFFLLLTFMYPDNSRALMAAQMATGKFPMVEGTISNFHRTFRSHKLGKETTEIFSVDSIHFSYSDAPIGKFNAFTETYNSVIFNGQNVKIIYLGNSGNGDTTATILQLEIGF